MIAHLALSDDPAIEAERAAAAELLEGLLEVSPRGRLASQQVQTEPRD